MFAIREANMAGSQEGSIIRQAAKLLSISEPVLRLAIRSSKASMRRLPVRKQPRVEATRQAS